MAAAKAEENQMLETHYHQYPSTCGASAGTMHESLRRGIQHHFEVQRSRCSYEASLLYSTTTPEKENCCSSCGKRHDLIHDERKQGIRHGLLTSCLLPPLDKGENEVEGGGRNESLAKEIGGYLKCKCLSRSTPLIAKGKNTRKRSRRVKEVDEECVKDLVSSFAKLAPCSKTGQDIAKRRSHEDGEELEKHESREDKNFDKDCKDEQLEKVISVLSNLTTSRDAKKSSLLEKRKEVKKRHRDDTKCASEEELASMLRNCEIKENAAASFMPYIM